MFLPKRHWTLHSLNHKEAQRVTALPWIFNVACQNVQLSQQQSCWSYGCI